MEQFLRNTMAQYGDTVYRLALCRLQNIPDAEDVYQDVFLRFLSQDAEDWSGDHLKFWLIRTTLNRCADVGRFRFRRSTIPLSDVVQTAQTGIDEDAAELWDAVAHLPVKLRTPLHLHYMEGYTTDEIASILKIPANTVRTRLYRARKRLKSLLGGCDDEKVISADDETDTCPDRIK